VVAQVAFAFVLLIGSGLLVASFRNLLFVDAGFKPDGVLTAGIWMPDVGYPGKVAVQSFTNRLLQDIRTIPGVSHAGATTMLPVSGSHDDDGWVILAEGYAMKPGESLVAPVRAIVTPGYFEAMGTPLLRGRNFDERDTDSAPGVVIVDERLAKKFWPGRDPIGRRMYEPSNPNFTPDEHTRWLTVVGVVHDVRLEDLSQPVSSGVYYYPASQWFQRGIILTIKTNRDPTSVLPALRARIGQLDSSMLLMDVKTMDEYESLSLMPRRAELVLATFFGIVALFLSAIGIYGVLAFLVTQRSREIGIRIALGSTHRGIFALVVREGLALAGVGLCLGVVGTVALRQVLQSRIYGLSTMNPVVMGAVMIVLALIALTAASLPARRATRVDPVAVLNRH
jgi:predicted permease